MRDDLAWIASLWHEEGKPSVWGWDKAVVAELVKRGVERTLMPSDEQLHAIRQLSNRSLAVEMLAYLRSIKGTTGHSAVCHTYDEVAAFSSQYGNTIVKAPWSSSGRGVKELSERNKAFILNTISKQGSVIAEQKCQRVRDFALEYSVDEQGKVVYQGLSLFSTSSGAYTGNLLLPEDEKLAILAAQLDIQLLRQVSQRIRQFLSPRLKGVYSGPFGVDMMVCGEPARALNPCIEINLRRTMGHVALALTQQGHRGTMTVLYNKERDKYELNINQNITL